MIGSIIERPPYPGDGGWESPPGCGPVAPDRAQLSAGGTVALARAREVLTGSVPFILEMCAACDSRAPKDAIRWRPDDSGGPSNAQPASAGRFFTAITSAADEEVQDRLHGR